jgi:hypothetical protein
MDATTMVRRGFVRRIAARFFVRFHMSLIFTATVGAAVLASRLLFVAGVDSIMLRYAGAVVGAYLVFLGLVRVWILWVTKVWLHHSGAELTDVAPSGSGHGAPFHPGGGHFGGGGAGRSFDEPPVFRSLAEAGGGGDGGGGDGGEASGGGGGWSLDVDDAIPRRRSRRSSRRVSSSRRSAARPAAGRVGSSARRSSPSSCYSRRRSSSDGRSTTHARPPAG